MMDSIAIVIPAFKALYLRDALAAFARQTEQGFRVYVGDDASPEDLEKICAEFSGQLDLRYHRFEKNLGGTSLIAQWNRCVALSSEPWIWLFSDDDVADEACIESFHRTLAETRAAYDVYHFDVTTIDHEGRTYRVLDAYDETLSALQFIGKRLRYEISSYAVEYIFSRKAFERENGFVNFAAGWGADDASWAAFAGNQGIRTIAGAKVHWRTSPSNISNAASPYKREKIIGAVSFLVWLKTRYRHQMTSGTTENFQPLLRPWFDTQLWQINPVIGPWHAVKLAWQLSRVTHTSFFKDYYRLMRNDMRARVNRRATLTG